MTREEIVSDALAADAACEHAAESVIATADGLASLAADLAKDRPDVSAALDRYVAELLQACAFRDLVGQRLARMAGKSPAHDPLARGPVNGAGALGQATVDALLI